VTFLQKLATIAVYPREDVEPAYLKDVRAFRLANIRTQSPFRSPKVLAWPSIASKNLVIANYDHLSARRLGRPARQRRGGSRIQTDSLPDERELAAKVGRHDVSEKLLAMTVTATAVKFISNPYEGAKSRG